MTEQQAEQEQAEQDHVGLMLPKVTYFDVRGRAEIIRLLLEESSTAYHERRITIDEWPELKSNFTFGQIPVYEEGELLLNQCNAIYRYLGRKLDLYGDSALEHVRCDLVQESFVGAQSKLANFYWDPDFENLRDDYEKTELPELLSELQNLFCANSTNSGFWVGNRLSYVDFIAWHFLDSVRPFSLRTLNKFDKLVKFKQRIESRPRISAYLKSDRRPKTLTVALSRFGGTPETS